MNTLAMILLALMGRTGDDPLPGPVNLLAEEPAPPPEAAAGPEFTFRIAPVFRWITGHTKVREDVVEGTRLDLQQDLGLGPAVGGNAQFEIQSASVDFLTEVDELFGSGGRTADQPFAWNGTVYTAPSQVRAHSSFLTVRAEVAFKVLADREARSWLGPAVGIEWPYYTLSVGTNLQHGSLEDWVHYLPYPILGLAGRLALSDSVDLGGRVLAGYLPNVPTPYTEGGRLYVSVRPSVTVEAPLAWHVSPSFELSCTLTYQYWVGNDHSHEDGNTLTLSMPGVMVGVGYRW